MIQNLNKKTKLEIKTKICESALSKSIGLMFSKKQNMILVFKFKFGKIVPLHMLFVFYQIDVLFLNEEKIIIELKKNFRPFSFYTPKEKAMYVVEMPSGSIKRLNVEIGDKIGF